MLRYAATGPRSYGDRPIPPHVRNVWELQAVIEGGCSQWLPERRMPRRERTLWISDPHLRHGWVAERGTSCRIAVIHLTALPEPLRHATGERGWLELRLDDGVRDRFAGLCRLAAAIAADDPLAPLRAEAAAAAICLLVAEALPPGILRGAPASPGKAVAAALAWYGEHLAERPGLAEVARAGGISVAHLRRLFHAEQRRPPRAAFNELRLARADELLRDPTLRLADIAERAGFASGALFSRTFRRYRGMPPAAWARRTRGRPAQGLQPALPLPAGGPAPVQRA